MKKLILLAALSLVFLSGYSQAKILNSSTDTVYFQRNGLTKSPPPDEMFIVKFLMYWDGYVKECFDDSTKFDGALLKTAGGYKFIAKKPNPKLGEFVNYSYIKDTTIYNHKEPTFEGFMDYLKKKYNY